MYNTNCKQRGSLQTTNERIFLKGGTINYWLGPNSVANAKISLDLGCKTYVRTVRLKNTHNQGHRDRQGSN